MCIGEEVQWPLEQAAFLLFSLVPLNFNLTSLNSGQINILARLRAFRLPNFNSKVKAVSGG